MRDDVRVRDAVPCPATACHPGMQHCPAASSSQRLQSTCSSAPQPTGRTRRRLTGGSWLRRTHRWLRGTRRWRSCGKRSGCALTVLPRQCSSAPLQRWQASSPADAKCSQQVEAAASGRSSCRQLGGAAGVVVLHFALWAPHLFSAPSSMQGIAKLEGLRPGASEAAAAAVGQARAAPRCAAPPRPATQRAAGSARRAPGSGRAAGRSGPVSRAGRQCWEVAGVLELINALFLLLPSPLKPVGPWPSCSCADEVEELLQQLELEDEDSETQAAEIDGESARCRGCVRCPASTAWPALRLTAPASLVSAGCSGCTAELLDELSQQLEAMRALVPNFAGADAEASSSAAAGCALAGQVLVGAAPPVRMPCHAHFAPGMHNAQPFVPLPRPPTCLQASCCKRRCRRV